tara:strand:+ start:1477 stop:1692 length:216 start_codon:yes stop_codon:yes gene_type:complete
MPKRRCLVCKKKLGLIDQCCKYCNNDYCLHHLPIEGHDCKEKEKCINEQKERHEKELNSCNANFKKVIMIS